MARSRRLTLANNDSAAVPPDTAAREERRFIRISDIALAESRRRPTRRQRDELRTLGRDTFSPADPMPGVVPSGHKPLAQDEAPLLQFSSWAADTYYNSAIAEGTVFLGYAYLAALSQRSEYRVVSETLANESTREWIEIKSAGDDKGKAKAIGKINDEFDRLDVQDVICTAVEQDGLFGRGHIYLDTGHTDDLEELVTSLGDGRDKASQAKVGRDNPLQALRTVEPTWTYPSRYNSRDPLSATWYRPETWYVMGKEIHHTRLLTFVGRPVSDMLKPAYAFGGLSMTQMLKPYVDNWLRTRQSVSDLIHSFAIPVLKTNLDALIKPGGDQIIMNRADFFNNMRDNRSLMLLDRDSEDFAAVQISLGTLDQLQAQAQEQMAAIARIPLVKLLGISPHGLNASSEGELRAFYDWLRSFQRRLIGPKLRTIFYLVQLSLFDKIDPDLTFDFRSLWQLDETARAQVNATKAQTYATDIQSGVVDPNEVREAYREDKNSPYSGLDLEGDAPGPPGMSDASGMDPLSASQGDKEDPDAGDRVDKWRQRAASLFDDEEELGYWTQRAADLFDVSAPDRWAALAAKLFTTSNNPEPLDVWHHRANRWAERAAELETNAGRELDDLEDDQPYAENVVSIFPAEKERASSPHIRWDTPDGAGRSRYARPPAEAGRWRDAAVRIARNIAQDASATEFSEEKHPRDKNGKFAKKEHANPDYEKTLKNHGYTEHPDFKNTAVYHHPSGHHFAIMAPEPAFLAKKGYSQGIKHLPPHGKLTSIYNNKALLAKLNELHGSKEKALEEAKGSAGASTGQTETKPVSSNEPTPPLKVPSTFGEAPIHVNPVNKAKTYEDAKGNTLLAMANGKWYLSNKSYELVAEGKGQSELNEAAKKHLSSLDISPQLKAQFDKMPSQAKQTALSLRDAGYKIEPHSLGVQIIKDNKDIADIFFDGSWGINNPGHSGYIDAGGFSSIEKIPELIAKYNGEGASQKAKEPQPASASATSGKKLSAPFPGGVAPPSSKFELFSKSDEESIYTTKEGEELAIFSDGSWTLYNSEGKESASGWVPEVGLKESQKKLNDAFEALHPRGEGGKFVAKPGGEETKPPQFVELGDKPFKTGPAPPKGFELTWSPLSNAKMYTNGEGGILITPKGWQLYDQDYKKIGEGVDQESLNQAVLAQSSQSVELGDKPFSSGVSKTGSVGAPLNPEGLKKIGEQKGSNPGGVYQDEENDKKYYIKFTKSPDHAKNELLAARLYQLAGSPTLDYHPAGDKGVATDWDELKADSVNKLTDVQRKLARKDFATHAWLANWDAVGLNNDNIGVNSKGVPVSLDLGGSLQYRAKGTEKGSAFGDEVGEWETLRDPSKNPTAAAFFKDMTPAEIAESASKVAQVKNDQIIAAVADAGYHGTTGLELAKKLIARRDDVIARSKEEFSKKKNSPSPSDVAPPLHKNYSSWTATYRARLKAQPPPTEQEAKAITKYSEDSYKEWNKELRNSFGKKAGQYSKDTIQLDNWLSKASFPEDAIVKRRVSDEYAAYLIEEAESYAEVGGHEHGQHQFEDHGYISTDNWVGSLTIEISIPKGARAAAIGNYSNHPNENEILIARGSKFRVDSFDSSTMTLKASLIRSGPAKGGIWHINPKKE